MAGVFSDQAFVDRLVQRVRGRFCYVMAWRLWFERVEGYWRVNNAEARLRDEYRLTVEQVDDGDEISLTTRRKAINAQSQQAALWLLREEEKLRALPEQVAFRLKRPGSDSLSACAHESLQAFGPSVAGMVERAYSDADHGPNILLRLDHQARDPGELYGLIAGCFGERVVRVTADYWKNFAWTPALALKLAGASIVFLDGMENWHPHRHFPQEAIRRFASRGEHEWEGKDGVWYPLRLPGYYVLTGPPVRWDRLELEFRQQAIPLGSKGEPR